MKITTTTQNTYKVVAPTRLAGDAVQSLRSDIEKALGSGPSHIMVDLSQTKQVDSAGLSALIDGQGRARNLGREAVLVGPNARMRSLLELTRIHRVMEVFEHEQAAAGFFVQTFAESYPAAA